MTPSSRATPAPARSAASPRQPSRRGRSCNAATTRHSARMTRGDNAAFAARTRARFPAQVRDDLRLELVRRPQAGQFYRLLDRNRDQVGRWMAWVPSITGPDSMLSWIRRCQRQLSGGHGFDLALVLDGDVAGTVGLVEIDRANSATELGYW